MQTQITIDELKTYPFWCVWKYVERDGKQTKPPVNPNTGDFAKVNDPKSFDLFSVAVNALKAHKNELNGVGIVLDRIEKDGTVYRVCGIDIDTHRCADNELAPEVCEMFKDTYIEKSPSKTGLHILFLVAENKIPADFSKRYFNKVQAKEIECYTDRRYLTYTGEREAFSAPALADMSDKFFDFLEKYMKKPTEKKQTAPAVVATPASSAPTSEPTALINISERLEMARQNKKNGYKFIKLYDLGDWNGYPSASEARMRLCGLLAFWLNKDENLVLEAYKNSALWRADKAHDIGCVKKAVDSCMSCYTPSKTYKKTYTGEGEEQREKKEDLTLDNFRIWINSHYDVYYDLVSHKSNFKGICKGNSMFDENTAPTYLEAELCKEFDKVTIAKVERFLNAIISENCRNPLTEALETSEWDGIDRLQEVYEIFGINHQTAEDELSRTFFRKWFMQAVAMLYNGENGNSYSPEFVLVLQGMQGRGKTRFFEHLVPAEYWGEGEDVDVRDKDKVMQITSNWICELGEIGSTMKKDVDSVKAFITKGYDEYRAPYGKKSMRYPRHTTFVGTVNNKEYLLDDTGNRRWATVVLPPELRIDYNRVQKLNSWQLWCQIYAMMIQGNMPFGSCFRLTEQEREAQEKRNAEHSKPLKGEVEVCDMITSEQIKTAREEADKSCRLIHRYMTATQFKQRHNDVLGKYSSAEIGRVLEKLGYKQITRRMNGVPTKVRLLPYKSFQGEVDEAPQEDFTSIQIDLDPPF